MPPNVLLIVADDIPRNALGAYGARHGLSPAIDALASGRGGVAFDAAYTTSPLCTPARYSLLTGRYASNASSIASHRPWNLVAFNTFLTGAVPTLAHRLRDAGYVTALVGKYHLGFPAGKPRSVSTPHRAAFNGGGRGLNYAELRAAVQRYAGFERVEALWGGNRQTARAAHHPEYMAARATAVMREAAASGRPWFVYFAVRAYERGRGIPTMPPKGLRMGDDLESAANKTENTGGGDLRSDIQP